MSDELDSDEVKKRIAQVWYILAVGNLKIGFEFWGPFGTEREAWDFSAQFDCDRDVYEVKYAPTTLEDMIARGEFDE